MIDAEQKQIDTMAKDLCEAEFWEFCEESNDLELNREETAKNLYDIGYRKSSIGKWIVSGGDKDRRAECSNCHHEYAVQKGMLQLHKLSHCTDCGAIMEDVNGT